MWEQDLIRGDWQRCKNDPWYWIKTYVKTYDRDGSIKPFPDYQYLEDMVDDLQNNKVTIWHKSRQMLASWLVTAYCLWMVIFHARIAVLAISKNGEESKDLGVRIDFMWSQLPEAFKLPKASDNVKEFSVQHDIGHSDVKFRAASKSAGRGPQAYFFVADEFAHTQYAREIFTGLKPSIDGGGRGVILSTGNGTHTKFYELKQQAAKLGIKLRKIHYSLNPEKDAKWKAQAEIGLSKDEWDQEQECKDITFEGLVYDEYNEAVHRVPLPDIWANGRFYVSIDFGFNNPFVALYVYSPAPDFVDFYIIGEHYQAGKLLNHHAEKIAELERQYTIKVTEDKDLEQHVRPSWEFGHAAVADPSGKQERAELAQHGIRTVPGKTDKLPGIQAVKQKLQIDARTGKPHLFLCYDPKTGQSLCPNTEVEFDNYHWIKSKDDVNEKEEPAKINDHSMDCLKNLFLKLRKGGAKGHRKKPKGW